MIFWSMLAFFLVFYPNKMDNDFIFLPLKKGQGENSNSDKGRIPELLNNKLILLFKLGLENGFSVRDSLAKTSYLLEPELKRELEKILYKASLGLDLSNIWQHKNKNLNDFLQICFLLENTGGNGVNIINNFLLQQRKNIREKMTEKAKKSEVRIALPLGLCFLPAFICLGVLPIVYSLAKNIIVNF